VGDFGGGGMFLAYGMMCAIYDAQRTGRGQIVDAAVCDGAAVLTSLMQGWRGTQQWSVAPRANVGNGAAPFFNTYRCADGRDISVGPIEDKFYQMLREACGLASPAFADQWDQAAWPEAKAELAKVFATRSRADWMKLLEGTDACFAPVLDLAEAPRHPHNVARQTFVDVDGVTQPAPAPRFSRSGSRVGLPVSAPGADTEAVLREIGLSQDEIDALH
jgi:alpha-methylacyl-CoA racemase